MTEQKIKEGLSNGFISLLANNKGYSLDKPNNDEGVDFQLKKSVPYQMNGQLRYTTDPRYIDIQLKSTTVNSIVEEVDSIKYDLEVKNYNDLIIRKDGFVPLILILFILPSEQNDWLEINDSEMKIRRNAYWYQPEETSQSQNTQKIRITIPKVNMLGIDCFNEIHSVLYP